MARRITHAETVTTTNIVTTDSSTPFDVSRAKMVSVQSVVDVNTPAAKTFAAGTDAVSTFTTANLAGTTGGDYGAFYDGSGLRWAFALNKAGTDPAPTGAIYAAIPAGRKVNVDVSGATTATNIADLVRTAMNALTGFTAAITLSGTATIIATRVVRAPVTASAVKNADDSGAGSISVADGTAGVASKVSVSGDTITITAHGLTTGLKGQASSTGTLPAGITTATDYFVISVDANTIQLASSLVLAQAGTAIDLTGQGTTASTHTFTPTAVAGGSLTMQKSNDYDPEQNTTGTWDAVESATSITADGDVWISDIDPEYKWCRLQFALTAGRLSAVSTIIVKGDV